MWNLHIALRKRLTLLCGLVAATGFALTSQAEVIGLSFPDTVVPGESVAVDVTLRENSNPLYSYALQLVVDDSGLTGGSVAPNFFASDFAPAENLIAQGGGNLVSQIVDNHDGMLVASAFNGDFTGVDLADIGRDALARVFFDVSLDAAGTFKVTLDEQVITELRDAFFNNVDFEIDYDASTPGVDATPPTITVIPEPTMFGLACVSLIALVRRPQRRRFA